MSGKFYESWPSDELRGIFESLLDQNYGGVPRFRSGHVKVLALTVYFRAFWTPIYDLCHLVHGIGLSRQGDLRAYERFFWDQQPARQDKFHRHFARADSAATRDVMAVAPSSIRLSYDGVQKSVKFSDMPYLAAVNEFCVEALGWVKLHEHFLPLFEREVKIEDVKSVSNALCRQLYGYLKDHLPPVQAVKQADLAINYAKKTCGDDFTAHDISDPLVLAFWRQYSVEGDIDGTRTFANVYSIFLSLIEAMEQGEKAARFANPASIGFDPEAGEVDLDRESFEWDDYWDSGEEEAASPLEGLNEMPAATVKFLNKMETRRASQVLDQGSYLYQLLLSHMRMMVFGAAQGRIPTALKSKAPTDSLDICIEGAIASDYESEVGEVEKLVKHLERVQLASLYVLTLKDQSAVDGALAVRHADFSVLNRAKQAFAAINRAGFRDQDLENTEMVAGHKAAVPSLTAVTEKISRHLTKLNGQGDWAEQFAADQPVFLDQFRAIYQNYGEVA